VIKLAFLGQSVLLARHRQTGISSVIAGLGFFLLGQINPCL